VHDGERARIIPVRRAAQELAELPPRTTGLQLALLKLDVHHDELAGRLAYIDLLAMRMTQRTKLRAA